MNIVELSTDNIVSFLQFVPEDIADHIGRIFHHGMIAVEGDTPLAGMAWELKNMLEDAPKESRILWLKAEDETAAAELFERYTEDIALDDVERSCYTIPAAPDSREKEFLEAQGFTSELTEGDEISATLDQISEIPLMKKTKPDPSIKTLMSVNQAAFSATARRMAGKGHRGICEDLIYLPRMYFENDVSCFYEEDGQIRALLLFHRLPSGNLRVVLMAAIGKDANQLLVKLMKNALMEVEELYPPDTKIFIDRHNLATLALGEKLFPNEIGMPIYIGSRKEGQ